MVVNAPVSINHSLNNDPLSSGLSLFFILKVVAIPPIPNGKRSKGMFRELKLLPINTEIRDMKNKTNPVREITSRILSTESTFLYSFLIALKVSLRDSRKLIKIPLYTLLI